MRNRQILTRFREITCSIHDNTAREVSYQATCDKMADKYCLETLSYLDNNIISLSSDRTSLPACKGQDGLHFMNIMLG